MASAHPVAPIACCLDEALAGRILACAPGVQIVEDPSGLVDRVATGRAEIVIADPLFAGGRCADAMIQIYEMYPSVRVAAYTRVEPEAVRYLVRLASHGIDDVVLFRHDDTPARIGELLVRESSDVLVRLVLHELTGNLKKLPVAVHSAVTAMFRAPVHIRSASDLAFAARVTRRTLHRDLQSAGIGSVRLLVVCARVLRAVVLLRDRGRTARDVALQLRYSKAEHLAGHLNEVLELSVRDVRECRDLVNLAKVIARRLRSSEAHPPVDAAD